jgi:predicted alpha/beta hydrolase family esterase
MRALTATFLFVITAQFASRPAAAADISPLEQLTVQSPAPAPDVTVPLLPEVRVPGNDLSASYQGALQAADAATDADFAAKLAPFKVIFVPGFLSDFDPGQIHIPGINFQHKIYFDEQMNWLKALGVPYERLSMKSEDAVDQNAPTVQAAIKASDRPVILIAHSKGGLDTLEALISDRSLLAKVRGVITLQSPYYGTPIADYVVSNTTLDDVAVKLLLKLGGNKESMVNLTTTDRVPYMQANAAAVAAIEAAVPVLTIGTWKDPVQGQYDTKLKPLRDFLLRRGLRSDGLVPVESALLPGSAYMKVPGLDHTVTVRPSNYIALDRVKMTKALLLTLFGLQAPSAGI